MLPRRAFPLRSPQPTELVRSAMANLARTSHMIPSACLGGVEGKGGGGLDNFEYFEYLIS